MQTVYTECFVDFVVTNLVFGWVFRMVHQNGRVARWFHHWNSMDLKSNSQKYLIHTPHLSF